MWLEVSQPKTKVLSPKLGYLLNKALVKQSSQGSLVFTDPRLRNEDPFDTMVDITNPDATPDTSISTGLAKIYINKEWGSVCNMQKPDADTFCRQLGYTDAVNVEDRVVL